MIHRAIFGSIERFFGILVENCAGEFPLWLAPEQVRILPVTESVQDYCHEVKRKAMEMGLRVEVDSGRDRLPKQIRNAEKGKVPLMAVVGVKELENGELAIRSKGEGDLGTFGVDEFLQGIKQAIEVTEEFKTVGVKEEKEEQLDAAD